MGSQIHTGSYVLLPSERDSQCYPECMLCSNWANILCAGSCIFHIQTDTRTNKQHSLLTCVGLYLLPPVSFYLKGLVPELLPLLCLTSKLLSFGMCTPNYRHKKHFGLPSRGTGSVPVQNFHKLLCSTHRGSECLLTSFLCLTWWSAVGFSLEIHCSSPELEVILSKHLVMTQAAYQIHITCDSLSWGWPVPGKLDFVYFQTVPYIYMEPGCDDTSARWKCFQCLCPGSKGLMGTSTGDVTQEAPWANPLHPHLLPKPPAPLSPFDLHSPQQRWGQLTH